MENKPEEEVKLTEITKEENKEEIPTTDLNPSEEKKEEEKKEEEKKEEEKKEETLAIKSSKTRKTNKLFR